MSRSCAQRRQNCTQGDARYSSNSHDISRAWIPGSSNSRRTLRFTCWTCAAMYSSFPSGLSNTSKPRSRTVPTGWAATSPELQTQVLLATDARTIPHASPPRSGDARRCMCRCRPRQCSLHPLGFQTGACGQAKLAGAGGYSICWRCWAKVRARRPQQPLHGHRWLVC